MCTYTTHCLELDGSGRGPGGDWLHVSRAIVYFDHPVHALAEHTLNVDLTDPERGPAARIALELTATSARALVTAIEAALSAAPREMTN